MNKEEAISALSLFIEKAAKLGNSNFIKNAVSGSGLTLSVGVGKPLTVTRTGPNEESIDAFVLTFRYFIQDNERISLRKFHNVFHSPFATSEEGVTFDEVRAQVNGFLAGDTMFNFGGKIKRCELMDIFVYGGLSHANEEKKKRYDSWMANPLIAQFMQNEFIVILSEILNAIMYIKSMSDTVLERLTAT